MIIFPNGINLTRRLIVGLVGIPLLILLITLIIVKNSSREPVSFFTINAPPSFVRALVKLNAEDQVFRSLRKDELTVDAGAYAIFLKHRNDLDSLPPAFREVYTSEVEIYPPAVSRKVFVGLKREGSDGMQTIDSTLHFYVLENYGDYTEEQISCLAALDFYATTSGKMSRTERKRRVGTCKELEIY